MFEALSPTKKAPVSLEIGAILETQDRLSLAYKKLGEIQEVMRRHKKGISSLDENIAHIKAQIVTLETTVADIKADISLNPDGIKDKEKDSRLGALANEAAGLKAELENMVSEKSPLCALLEALQRKLDETQTVIKEAQAKKKALLVSHLEAEAEAVGAKYAALAHEIDQLLGRMWGLEQMTVELTGSGYCFIYPHTPLTSSVGVSLPGFRLKNTKYGDHRHSCALQGVNHLLLENARNDEIKALESRGIETADLLSQKGN